MILTLGILVALFPDLHAQLLSFAVREAGGRPGTIYHVMCATDIVTHANDIIL